MQNSILLILNSLEYKLQHTTVSYKWRWRQYFNKLFFFLLEIASIPLIKTKILLITYKWRRGVLMRVCGVVNLHGQLTCNQMDFSQWDIHYFCIEFMLPVKGFTVCGMYRCRIFYKRFSNYFNDLDWVYCTIQTIIWLSEFIKRICSRKSFLLTDNATEAT